MSIFEKKKKNLLICWYYFKKILFDRQDIQFFCNFFIVFFFGCKLSKNISVLYLGFVFLRGDKEDVYYIYCSYYENVDFRQLDCDIKVILWCLMVGNDFWYC